MQDNILEVVSPESVGVPSGAILKTLRYFESLRLPLHSFLILRHGKIAHENYWTPFHQTRKHRMYSVSKSWVSLAVGLMIDEGKLSLDDTVVSFFPEYMPPDAHEYLKRATIRDMLRMADCHDSSTHWFGAPDWAKTWFDTPPTHPAGTIFSYNTTCTNLCCAIVEKIAGMNFIDYMYPRLLGPIGASDGITCIEAPEGYSFGGSGVLCEPRDLARVALLCLNGGDWRGRRLISEQYIKEATTRQIDNTLTTSDFNEQQGYGYQFWMTRHSGFACLGMGSQFAICLSDLDMVIVVTADTQGIATAAHTIFEGLFNLLTPAVSGAPMPEDAASNDELTKYSVGLALPLVVCPPHSPRATDAAAPPAKGSISGRTYLFGDNPLNIRTVSFEILSDEIAMTYEKPNGTYKLRFGVGNLIKQEFPEKHYSGMRIGTPAGRGYETYAGAAWAGDGTIIAKAYVTDDYLGSFNMNATFKGDELVILMTKDAEGFLHDYTGFATGRRIL